MLKIYFRKRAFKDFAKLDKEYQLRISAALDEISRGKFLGQNVEKIQGTEFGYRLRVGRWRALFALSFDKKQIEIVDIFLKKGRQDYKRRIGLL